MTDWKTGVKDRTMIQTKKEREKMRNHFSRSLFLFPWFLILSCLVGEQLCPVDGTVWLGVSADTDLLVSGI